MYITLLKYRLSAADKFAKLWLFLYVTQIIISTVAFGPHIEPLNELESRIDFFISIPLYVAFVLYGACIRLVIKMFASMQVMSKEEFDQMQNESENK